MKSHVHRAAPSLNSLLDQLKNSGLKITAPRKGILKVLLDEHGPFSAEEIRARLPKNICDLATVYRSLTTLEEAKILMRTEFGDGLSRYAVCGDHDHHHHHIVCGRCKKIEIIDDHEIEAIDRFAKRKGYTKVTHILEFFGLCPACSKAG